MLTCLTVSGNCPVCLCFKNARTAFSGYVFSKLVFVKVIEPVRVALWVPTEVNCSRLGAPSLPLLLGHSTLHENKNAKNYLVKLLALSEIFQTTN